MARLDPSRKLRLAQEAGLRSLLARALGAKQLQCEATLAVTFGSENNAASAMPELAPEPVGAYPISRGKTVLTHRAIILGKR